MATHRELVLSLWVTTGAVLLGACGSGGAGPQPLPPQTMAPTPPETPDLSNRDEADRFAAGEPDSEMPIEPGPVVESVGSVAAEDSPSSGSSAREIVPVAPKNDKLTVILDPGTDAGEQSQSIFAASQAEKQRREEIGESTIILNNETLKEYSKESFASAEGDEANETSSDRGDTVTVADSGDPPAPGMEEPDETYWRNLVLDIRLAWRRSVDDIEDFESDIARLRRDFYAEDDPFYRDGQIKPAWDQALRDLEEAKRTVERSQLDLDRAIEDGRRAGALPGWLREGMELEPVVEEDEPARFRDDRFHESSEPVLVDDDDGG